MSLEAPGRPCPTTHVRTAKGHDPFFLFTFFFCFFFSFLYFMILIFLNLLYIFIHLFLCLPFLLFFSPSS